MSGIEPLDEWRSGILFADLVYSGARDIAHRDGGHALAQTMRRAAVSIATNLAHGGSRSSRSDHARSIGIAIDSLHEIDSMLLAGRYKGWIQQDDFELLVISSSELGGMLSGLRRSLSGDS